MTKPLVMQLDFLFQDLGCFVIHPQLNAIAASF